MTQRRIFLMLLTTLVIIGISYWSPALRSVPSSQTQVDVSIDSENSGPVLGMKTTDQLIEFWRARFDRDPRDFISLTFLGEAFIRKARETGDVSAYDRAEATLKRALEIDPNYDGAIAYLSTVRFVKHDFSSALDLAQQVYAIHPNALQALATIGDAQLELGHYAEAETVYKQLLDKNPSPAVYSRLSRLAWLKGNPTEALSKMQQAADEAKALDLAGENVAWYQFQVGELYFNIGQMDEAAQNYTAALDSFNNYYLALAGMGKVRAAQGKYNQAIDFYQRAIAIIPQPDFLAALGDLLTLTGQSAEAKRQYDTVEFIAKLAAVNQVIYNRQLVHFYANHNQNLDNALQLATNEIAVRKDIYGYDTLAWALYKNKRYAEAAEAMQQAMKLGTRDALLYYHVGMIYEALGDNAQAEKMLSEAMTINPHFDLMQARIARYMLAYLQVR
jgi:tetratricopeptide (TPR) repeat protein